MLPRRWVDFTCVLGTLFFKMILSSFDVRVEFWKDLETLNFESIEVIVRRGITQRLHAPPQAGEVLCASLCQSLNGG
jgi:hypothetical protein